MTDSIGKHSYTDVLRQEFASGDASFLVQLCSERRWDKASFSRLVAAIKAYCEIHVHSETVERWVAWGIWYLQQSTRTWTTHTSFPKPYPSTYHEAAYQLIDDLAYWFFTGDHGYQDKKSIERLVEQVNNH